MPQSLNELRLMQQALSPISQYGDVYASRRRGEGGVSIIPDVDAMGIYGPDAYNLAASMNFPNQPQTREQIRAEFAPELNEETQMRQAAQLAQIQRMGSSVDLTPYLSPELIGQNTEPFTSVPPNIAPQVLNLFTPPEKAPMSEYQRERLELERVRLEQAQAEKVEKKEAGITPAQARQLYGQLWSEARIRKQSSQDRNTPLAQLIKEIAEEAGYDLSQLNVLRGEGIEAEPVSIPSTSPTMKVGPSPQRETILEGAKRATQGMVKMIAPNGETADIPAEQVEHFTSLGAKVVQ